MSNSRKRRAAPVDLYKSCQLGGDCFPDVQNKIEGKTLADRLLQIFSSVLYFGGLGIGTGKGTGGATGYKPLKTPIVRGGTRLPETIRPSIPIDPLGGADVIPLDVIDAAAPSVVPLTDGVPDTTIISSGIGPNVTIGDLDITTTIDETAVTVPKGDHPAIIDVSEEGASVIDVQNGPPPPKKIQLDTLLNPPETIDLVVPATTTYRDPNINVFVDAHIAGEVIGAEYIPLEELNTLQEFSIEESTPRTSTPSSNVTRLGTRAKDLYNRFVVQMPTQDLLTIVQPSRQVTFEFDNPAFSDDVSYEFKNDLREVTAAPNADFRDIQSLSRPKLAATESGAIRYSRLGQRASMQTRSGLIIGEKVHFYYDLSDINPIENIEMSTFATSADATAINAQSESFFINEAFEPFSEDVLLDNQLDNFQNSQLVLTFTTEESETVDIPTIPPNLSLKVFVPDVSNNIFVSYPTEGSIVPPYVPAVPVSPFMPVEMNIYGEAFVIDPYYLKRKRKRFALY